MKNTIKWFGFAALAVVMLAFAACSKPTGGHTHTPGAAADCTTAQTCTECGAVLVAALGHDYNWVVTNAAVYPAQSTGTCSHDGAHTTTHDTAIGDTGPGGGIIYYVGTFTMTGIGTCHYLEASPADLTGGTGSQATMRWTTATGSPYPATTGTLETIGSGKNNTAIIIAAESAAYPGNSYIYAARACGEYIGGGRDDWFLPSKDELNEMVKAKTHLGGISSGWFWSSSQHDDVDTWALLQQFGLGIQDSAAKSGLSHVRAIRAF